MNLLDTNYFDRGVPHAAVLALLVAIVLLIWRLSRVRATLGQILREERDRLKSQSLLDRMTARVMSRIFPLIALLAIISSVTMAGAIMFASLYSCINLVSNMAVHGFREVARFDLSSGALALRVTSVILVYSWFSVSFGNTWRLGPPSRDAVHRNSRLRTETDRDIATYHSTSEMAPTDNLIKEDLRKIQFAVLPRDLESFHFVLLGFYSIAIGFAWLLYSNFGLSHLSFKSPGDFGLPSFSLERGAISWLILFGVHDAGLVFGYLYFTKGRIVGTHALRIVGVAIAIVATMIWVVHYMREHDLDYTWFAALLAIAFMLILAAAGRGVAALRDVRDYYQQVALSSSAAPNNANA